MDVVANTMDTARTLEEAVREAAKGDHAAFRAVFDAGNDKLFRYFLGQVGSREEALDLLQDTFIDLWRALPRFRYRTADEFWGFAVASGALPGIGEMRSCHVWTAPCWQV